VTLRRAAFLFHADVPGGGTRFIALRCAARATSAAARTSAIRRPKLGPPMLNATSRVSGLRRQPGTGRGCASELPSLAEGC